MRNRLLLTVFAVFLLSAFALGVPSGGQSPEDVDDHQHGELGAARRAAARVREGHRHQGEGLRQRNRSAAINDGRDGNVDIIFVHAKAREEKFVEEGYGAYRLARHA